MAKYLRSLSLAANALPEKLQPSLFCSVKFSPRRHSKLELFWNSPPGHQPQLYLNLSVQLFVDSKSVKCGEALLFGFYVHLALNISLHQLLTEKSSG